MWSFLFAENHSFSVAAVMGVFFIGFWARGFIDRWTEKDS